MPAVKRSSKIHSRRASKGKTAGKTKSHKMSKKSTKRSLKGGAKIMSKRRVSRKTSRKSKRTSKKTIKRRTKKGKLISGGGFSPSNEAGEVQITNKETLEAARRRALKTRDDAVAAAAAAKAAPAAKASPAAPPSYTKGTNLSDDSGNTTRDGSTIPRVLEIPTHEKALKFKIYPYYIKDDPSKSFYFDISSSQSLERKHAEALGYYFAQFIAHTAPFDDKHRQRYLIFDRPVTRADLETLFAPDVPKKTIESFLTLMVHSINNKVQQRVQIDDALLYGMRDPTSPNFIPIQKVMSTPVPKKK